MLAETYEGKPLVGPNDATIDGRGRIYFTDLAGAAVYRIDAPGRLTRILAAPDVQRPNGIQVSPDDRKLYLIEANQAQGGARMIRSYDLQPDGTVRNMRVHTISAGQRRTDDSPIPREICTPRRLRQLRGSSATLDTSGIYVISPQGSCSSSFPSRKISYE